MPEVSVLMTVYNGMPYLRAAVESIQQQSLSEFSFVIVDDGSTDETPEYLAQVAESDSRVTVITQCNSGTAAAANQGLKHIDTEFVARMDADDVAMPERLRKQLDFLKSHPDIGLAGTQVAPIGEKEVGNSLQLPCNHEQIFPTMMQGRHGLAHSSIMIRTGVLKQLGGYWAKKLIDDWDMMLRVGEVSRLANLDEVLLHYRVHSGSLNGQSMWRMHRHINYAVECAVRRQADRDPISFEQYEDQLATRPLVSRISEQIHVYAMTHYRLAVAEIYGGNKVRGYGRLLWSAVCNPVRSIHRLKRLVRGRQNEAILSRAGHEHNLTAQ
ncbi:MAG: glycosyltransferase [Planctomycetota bacterium]